MPPGDRDLQPAEPKADGAVRRYRLLRRLGRGGYGTVYLAELTGEAGFHKRVAIKIANSAAIDPRVGARLLDEARMLALVRHRAIVSVEGLIRVDGRPAMVMEYVEGASLAEIAEHGPVPARAALGIASELAQALNAAWTARGPDGQELHLVHRDIKPGNIVLTAQGEVKLLDFGIARADIGERHAHTTQGAVPGSLDYLAPERTETGGFGPAADIFALGALLYELVRGEPLGQLRGNARQFERQLDGRLDLLAARVGRDSPVISLVGNMLSYRPEQRPNAREVRRDCDRLIERSEGLGLLDWAEEAVSTLSALRPAPGGDALLGRVVEEERFSFEGAIPLASAGVGAEQGERGPRGALAVSPDDAPVAGASSQRPQDVPRPVRRWLRWISGISAVVVALTGLVTQVDTLRQALFGERAPASPAAGSVPPEQAAQAAIQATPAPTPAPAAASPAPSAQEPVPPSPEAVAPTPAPVAPPPSKAQVRVAGNTTGLYVTASNGKATRLLPGSSTSLAAGTYRLSATFEATGDAAYPQGDLKLGAGATVRVLCDEVQTSCSW